MYNLEANIMYFLATIFILPVHLGVDLIRLGLGKQTSLFPETPVTASCRAKALLSGSACVGAFLAFVVFAALGI